MRQRTKTYEAWCKREHACVHVAGNCREEAEKTLARTDGLVTHTLPFGDRWDMEPCSEPFTLKEMMWDRSPNGGPEWIFMLNYRECIDKLPIVGWSIGDGTYAEEPRRFLFHWIQANPILPEGTVTTRAIGTGI